MDLQGGGIAGPKGTAPEGATEEGNTRWVKEGDKSRVVRVESYKAKGSRISKWGSRIKRCGRVTKKVGPMSTAESKRGEGHY